MRPKNEREVQQDQPKKMLQKKEHAHSKRKKFRKLTDAAMKVDTDSSQFSFASEDEYTPRQDQSASKTMQVNMPRKVLASTAVSTMAYRDDELKMNHSTTAGITSSILKAIEANLVYFAASAST